MGPQRGLVKRLARRVGFDVVRHPGPATAAGRRIMRLRQYGVSLVVDVGSNAGQYAQAIRSAGYKGPILSIEPLPDAYARLSQAAKGHGNWVTLNHALGRESGTATLHVSRNSVSTSFLAMLPGHIAAEPASQVVQDIDVRVRTLRDVLQEHRAGPTTFVKIDTQGFELEILEGAGDQLMGVIGVEVEMSLVPLYRDAPSMTAVIEWLERRGFWLVDLEPEFNDPSTGRLLQVNGLFYRRNDMEAARA